MSEKKETKTDASAENKLIHAGQEVGKVIARSTFQAEQTGKKNKKEGGRYGFTAGQQQK